MTEGAEMADNNPNDLLIAATEERLKVDNQKEYEVFRSLDREKKIEYAINNQVKVIDNPDPAMVKRFNQLLYPILFKLFDPVMEKYLVDFLPELKRKATSAGELSLFIIKMLSQNKNMDNKNRTILTLPGILITFEGVFTVEADLIVFLLVLNGKEYFKKPEKNEKIRNNPLNGFSKLRNERMVTKAEFLQKEGFSEFVDKSHRNLRNAIAHANYEILETGGLEFYNKSGKATLTKAEVIESFQDLFEVTRCVLASILNFMNDKLEPEIEKLPAKTKAELKTAFKLGGL
jgi:hypothetical protein